RLTETDAQRPLPHGGGKHGNFLRARTAALPVLLAAHAAARLGRKIHLLRPTLRSEWPPAHSRAGALRGPARAEHHYPPSVSGHDRLQAPLTRPARIHRQLENHA